MLDHNAHSPQHHRSETPYTLNKVMQSGPTPLAGQWRHAQTLWRDYLAEPGLPQLDRWLRARLARNKQFGKRDRLVYADILFAAARFGYFSAFVLEHRDRQLDVDTVSADALNAFAAATDNVSALRHIFSRYAADDNIDFLTLSHWRQNHDSALPDQLIDVKPTIAALHERAMQHPGSSWSLLWHGIPLAHHAHIAARAQHEHWSDDIATRFLNAQDSRPTLWLRLNHDDERDEILDELKAQYQVTKYHEAIGIDGDKGIFDLACFKNGGIAIQDLASQQLAARVDCKPGDRVWDACAGGGGKTLAIAARLKNKGSIWASDIRAHKLDEIKRRAALSRFYNIRTAVWHGDVPLQFPKEIARHGGFDWVLVDAPCSSSGTWRRNPDAKLRNIDDDRAQLNQLQLQLLTQAAQNVRAGGKLVYGTCSFHLDENENIVAQFLRDNDQWQLCEQTLLGCPKQDSDTMFVAVLVSTKPGVSTTPGVATASQQEE